MPWKGVMMKHTTRVSTYQLGNNWIVKIQYFETCRLFCLYNWLPDIEVLLSQTLKKLLESIYRPRDVTGIEDCPCEEAVFPREDDDEEEVDNEEAEIGPSICRVLCPDDYDQLLDSHTALVYLQQLKALAMKKVDPLCKIKGCGGVLDIGIKHIGSAVYLKWVRFLLNGKLNSKVYTILLKIKVYLFFIVSDMSKLSCSGNMVLPASLEPRVTWWRPAYFLCHFIFWK